MPGGHEQREEHGACATQHTFSSSPVRRCVVLLFVLVQSVVLCNARTKALDAAHRWYRYVYHQETERTSSLAHNGIGPSPSLRATWNPPYAPHVRRQRNTGPANVCKSNAYQWRCWRLEALPVLTLLLFASYPIQKAGADLKAPIHTTAYK